MGSIGNPLEGDLDHILENVVGGDAPKLHNAFFFAKDKNGLLYSKAFGTRDLAGTTAVTPDSFFWIASLTKLSTALAALIAVDKGLVTLDQNVREIVPELADLEVLEGFDGETPRLRKTAAPISLRQLLSHSSGFCYDIQNPGLQRWAKYVGKKEGTFTGSHEGYKYPLIFEPGQGWAYGSGMDWAGRVIEVVSDQDLESFMKTTIWCPLSMLSTTFKPQTRPDLTSKLVDLAWRNPDGTLSKSKVPFGPATDCCGGVGLYSTPNDQAKLMTALLHGATDLLRPEIFQELFKPQCSDPSYFRKMMAGPLRSHLGQTWPAGHDGDFGLSSSINDEDFPRRRAAKSVNWQGMPGCHTWLDREEGVVGLFISQVLPPGDPVVTKTFLAAEEVVYANHHM